MAIEIKVRFIIIPFDESEKHDKAVKEYEDAINDGWAIDNSYQFDFSIVFEMKKYIPVKTI